MNSKQTLRKITLLAKNTDFVATFMKSMIDLGQQVVHIDSISEVIQLIKEGKCDVLVHVLRDFEREEVGYFHHRLVRSSKGQKIHRFLVYRDENSRAVAFAQDCGMLKSIRAESAMNTLGASLEVSLQGFEQLPPDVQRASQLIASGDCFLDNETAASVLEISEKFPNMRNFQIASARLYLHQGDTKRATQQIRRVIDDEPQNVRGLSVLGELLVEAGNVQEATKVLTSVEQSAAGNPYRLLCFAKLYCRLKQPEIARKFLMKSLDIRPLPQLTHEIINDISTSAPDKSQLTQAVDDSMAKIHSLFGE